MKNIKKSLLILALIAFTSPLFADSPYLLGQIGGSKKDYRWHEYDVTGRVAAGYQLDQSFHAVCIHYGVELGYQLYKTIHDNIYLDYYSLNASYHRKTIDLLAVLDVEAVWLVDVFVKFGPALVIKKEDHHSINSLLGERIYTDKYNKIHAKGMIGAGINITDSFNLNVAYSKESDGGRSGAFLAGIKFSLL